MKQNANQQHRSVRESRQAKCHAIVEDERAATEVAVENVVHVRLARGASEICMYIRLGVCGAGGAGCIGGPRGHSLAFKLCSMYEICRAHFHARMVMVMVMFAVNGVVLRWGQTILW